MTLMEYIFVAVLLKLLQRWASIEHSLSSQLAWHAILEPQKANHHRHDPPSFNKQLKVITTSNAPSSRLLRLGSSVSRMFAW